MSAARYYVSGKVQGVWFRASTREQALALGLRGYARNLADGRVEVLAAGADDALTQLQAWLQRGPTHARVDRVLREDAGEHEAGDGFVCS
ncbi:acylphosphatase [Lysobacter silvisoli]|uniref:Acylphosphatase n=1 Tax=Lysobacter silvisoli TaxID=2293254 RepID=A0A371K188_9GAMM|nr:acylphosphatase [Lysobacter silvisoli]RDZ27617.1 acylphosphatase [Lysobacter silvisoli]